MNENDIIRLATEVSLKFADRNYEAANDALVEFFTMAYTAGAAAEQQRLMAVGMAAAKIAIDEAVKLEREACARMVDHILKEGGGTYGKAIRARGET